MYYEQVYTLRMLKFLYDTGIFAKAMSGITRIGEGDYLEIFLRALENLSPSFEAEELGEEVCCGVHTLYHFGDPAIGEYYRLCRLYEYKHGVSPEDNPYVRKADDYFHDCCNSVHSNFGYGYDGDVHIREIQIEMCPERTVCEYEILTVVHDVLEYYRREAVTLRNEMMRGPWVWLPALPAPKENQKAA